MTKVLLWNILYTLTSGSVMPFPVSGVRISGQGLVVSMGGTDISPH
jgi:hypothetical protein